MPHMSRYRTRTLQPTTETDIPSFDVMAPHSNLRWAVSLLLLAGFALIVSCGPGLVGSTRWLSTGAFSTTQGLLVHLNSVGASVSYLLLAFAAGQTVFGRMLDRLGTKAGLSASVLCWIGALLLFWRTGTAELLPVLLLLGAGAGGFIPAILKASAEWFPQTERAIAIGLMNAGFWIAALFGTALLEFEVSRHGRMQSAGELAGCGLVWLLAWLVFPYRQLRRGSTLSQQHLQLPLRNAGLLPERMSMVEVLSRPETWAYSMAMVFAAPMPALVLFLPAAFPSQRPRWPFHFLDSSLLVVTVFAAAGGLLAGTVSSILLREGVSLNRARKHTMGLCALCVLPLFLVQWLHPVLWLRVPLLAVAALGLGGFAALLFTIPADTFPAAAVGTVAGIGSAIGSLATAVLLWTLRRYPVPLWWICFAPLLALAALQAFAPRLHRLE